jgi:nitroimidazol reductase NimA-like FMN-containing flavoprotein (pyridoxamine 5'-phosphate oxidase superfamily)
MKTRDDVEKRLRELLITQALAVVATSRDGHPYGSLVAFVATDDLRHLVFATSRSTRKFGNLAQNPRVAVVVDNRSNRREDFHEACAATATGPAEDLAGAERDTMQRLFLARHPHLVDFIASSNVALVRVTVEAYRFVSRFQEVMELRPSP